MEQVREHLHLAQLVYLVLLVQLEVERIVQMAVLVEAAVEVVQLDQSDHQQQDR